MSVPLGSPKDHFHGKSALRHIAEVQAGGISTSLEIHGAESPGPLFAFLDAARETAILIAAALFISDHFSFVFAQKLSICLSFVVGWAFWKGARSAFLAWSRLRRMHRIAIEEKEEIELNRPQEREELIALYGEKGFSGPLLDKVVDVLMADSDRLLRVMLQEEMGFRIQENPHPLIQGVMALAGVLFSLVVFIPFAFGFSVDVVLVFATLFIGVMGGIFARIEKNPVIPALVWNSMIAAVTLVLIHSCIGIFV